MKKMWMIILSLLLMGCSKKTPTPPIPTATIPPPTLAPSETLRPTITAFPTLPMVVDTQRAKIDATATANMDTQIAPTWPPTPDLIAFAPTLIIANVTVAGGGWSPDGKWVSFWSQRQNPTDPDIQWNRLTPGFYNVETGEICYQDEVTGTWSPEFSQTYDYWEPDRRSVLVVDKAPYIGSPCGSFEPAPPEKSANPAWDWSISPDGRYKAQTSYQFNPNIATTLITTTRTESVVQSVKWTHPGGQVWGTMGAWVDNDKFLLTQTVDRGPLLIEVGTGVKEVLPLPKS